MAAGDKEEFPPLLRPGFHKLTVTELRGLCVAKFPASITRSGLMTRLQAVIAMIQNGGMHGELWIDGSFLTEKLNPDDVDLILVVDDKEYQNFDANQAKFFNWFRLTSLYDQYRCDNYVLVRGGSMVEGEYLHAYWLRQFGFARSNEMKGLAVISIPFVVIP